MGGLRALGLPAFRSLTKVKLLNGGRSKWEAESRVYTREVPKFPAANYLSTGREAGCKDPCLQATKRSDQSNARKPLIDVRSPGEFRGEITHMPEYSASEGVPVAAIFQERAASHGKPRRTTTAAFKSAEDLHKIYIENLGVDPGDETIVYCRIGERSSHTWFVLTYLLGFPDVKNYDGSWTEWETPSVSQLRKAHETLASLPPICGLGACRPVEYPERLL